MLRYSSFELKGIKSLKDLKKNQDDVKKDLFNSYKNTTCADETTIGFIYEKNLYCIELNEINENIVKLSTDSKGGLKIMLSINKKQKRQWLIDGHVKKIMSETEFLQLVDSSKYNKGEMLEKLLTEKSRENMVQR